MKRYKAKVEYITTYEIEVLGETCADAREIAENIIWVDTNQGRLIGANVACVKIVKVED